MWPDQCHVCGEEGMRSQDGGNIPVAQVPGESRGATHAGVTPVVVQAGGHLQRAPELTLAHLS